MSNKENVCGESKAANFRKKAFKEKDEGEKYNPLCTEKITV